MKNMIFSCILFSMMTMNSVVVSKEEVIPQNQSPSTLEMAFIWGLGPFLLKAMEDNGDRKNDYMMLL